MNDDVNMFQGLCAIHSPHTGIVDWSQVARSYAKNFQDAGGEIELGYEVNVGLPNTMITTIF